MAAVRCLGLLWHSFRTRDCQKQSVRLQWTGSKNSTRRTRTALADLQSCFLGAGILRQLETSAVLFAELQVECSPGLRDSRCGRWVLTEPQLTNTQVVCEDGRSRITRTGVAATLQYENACILYTKLSIPSAQFLLRVFVRSELARLGGHRQPLRFESPRL